MYIIFEGFSAVLFLQLAVFFVTLFVKMLPIIIPTLYLLLTLLSLKYKAELCETM